MKNDLNKIFCEKTIDQICHWWKIQKQKNQLIILDNSILINNMIIRILVDNFIFESMFKVQEITNNKLTEVGKKS